MLKKKKKWRVLTTSSTTHKASDRGVTTETLLVPHSSGEYAPGFTERSSPEELFGTYPLFLICVETFYDRDSP